MSKLKNMLLVFSLSAGVLMLCGDKANAVELSTSVNGAAISKYYDPEILNHCVDAGSGYTETLKRSKCNHINRLVIGMPSVNVPPAPVPNPHPSPSPSPSPAPVPAPPAPVPNPHPSPSPSPSPAPAPAPPAPVPNPHSSSVSSPLLAQVSPAICEMV